MVEFTIPVRTVNITNVREHWGKRANRAKLQRTHAKYATVLQLNTSPHIRMPVIVTMERISPRKLDDDNLRPALKSIRDGIADAFGLDDNSPSIEWRYAQGKGKKSDYAVKITIEESK